MARPVSDAEFAGLIHQELIQSQNWHGSEWRESIKRALNYLLLRDKGDEVPGRSQVQSGDVADMIDHVQAELQPMYSGEELVQIEAESEEDEEQARQESSATNWYFFQRARGFDALDSAVQDGLLARNGYLKVWYEESYGLPYEETLEGTREQIDATLVQLSQENKVEPGEETIIQQQQTTMVEGIGPDGITPIAVEAEVLPEIRSAKLFVIPIRKETKVQSVAPEDMYVSRDAMGHCMQQPRMVAQRRRMTRQDVKALGFDPVQVDRMPTTSSYDSDVRTARKSDYNTYHRYAAHKSGEMVDLYEVYYKIDADGDDIPELHKIFYGFQKEIMRWADTGEPADEIVRVRPFASGSPMRVAHRHQGRSLADKEYQIEDTKRALLRQMLDNLYLGNDQTIIAGPTVEIDDLEETDIPRVVRAGNPADVQPFPYTNTAGESIAGLQYVDKIRRERGGSAIDMSAEAMPVNQAAHSTERVMSAMERLVAMYARNFARDLIRDAGVLLHQQLKLMPGELSFRTRDGWQKTEPRFWMERERISVTLGMSEGERMRKLGALNQTIEIQRADLQTPDTSILVSPSQMYRTRIEHAKAAGLVGSDHYLDPESPEGQQAIQAMQESAQAEREAAARQSQALIDSQIQMIAMQEETKRVQAQMKQIEEQRDRIAEMLQQARELAAKYTEMELKYAAEVPGKGIEGGEVVEIFPS